MNQSMSNAADAIRYAVAEKTAQQLYDKHKLQKGDRFTFHMDSLFNDTFGIPDKVYAVQVH